jgi:hypothetical protein
MCGDRIGVYEPIWLELADGSVHRSSYLNLGDYPGYDRSRLWHLHCLIYPTIPPPEESWLAHRRPTRRALLGGSLARRRARSEHRGENGVDDRSEGP